MTNACTIPNLPGYEDVRDLIPGGSFMHCTVVWRLSLEFYRDEVKGLGRRLVLELVGDLEDSAADRVAVILEEPEQISWPDSWQILGLDFKDMRDHWIVQHLHTLAQGEDCVKLIGVYATRDDAVGATMRLAGQPGFRDFPNVVESTTEDTQGFYVEEYEIGKDHWTEGFTTGCGS